MMKPRAHVGLLLVSALMLGWSSGCGTPPRAVDPFRRESGPREAVTVFSPLNLPTPNELRTAAGLPGPEYWQQRVDHVIRATLAPETQTLTATQQITYHNASPDELPFLWLHLEQNLMKVDSDGSRMSWRPRRAKMEDRFGFHVTAVKVGGQPVELQVYDSIGRVDLPTPVAARGGQVTLELEWTMVVPKEAPRMGIDEVEDGPIYELAQWFPTPVVYDDVHGWNILRYLGTGEFYTNFGSYDVALTVPRDYLVGATGVLQNPEEVLTPTQVARIAEARRTTKTVVIRGKDEIGQAASRPTGSGPLTWRFVAHDVRTFAWAASPAFIWDAAGIATRGRVPSELSGAVTDIPAGTLVQSLYPKEAVPNWEQSTDMLRFSIEHYNQQWFPYPYPTAINVNGPEGGMEYPMIIFCGARGQRRGPDGKLVASDPKAATRGLFGVTAHEIGHNWFPMVVNTDERRHAWMDEGFNSFINHYAFAARFAGDGEDGRNPVGGAERLREFSYQPIDMPADQISGSNYGMNQYRKTAAGLYMLREAVLGPERFDTAFRAYIRAWAFKSPRPGDFYRCMENQSGQDLAWLWRGWFMETGALDQAVVKVVQPKDDAPAKLTLRNRGDVVMPVHYRVTLADGTTRDERLPVEFWFLSDQRTIDVPTDGRRVQSVVLDPEEHLADADRLNNRWGKD